MWEFFENLNIECRRSTQSSFGKSIFPNLTVPQENRTKSAIKFSIKLL